MNFMFLTTAFSRLKRPTDNLLGKAAFYPLLHFTDIYAVEMNHITKSHEHIDLDPPEKTGG